MIGIKGVPNIYNRYKGKIIYLCKAQKQQGIPYLSFKKVQLVSRSSLVEIFDFEARISKVIHQYLLFVFPMIRPGRTMVD